MKTFVYMITLALFTVSNTVSAEILNLTIDKSGTVALGGTMLLITGTVTCDKPVGLIYSSVDVYGSVVQVSVGGKVVSQSSGFIGTQCSGDGSASPFTLQMNYNSGSPFKPGPATVTVVANQYVCDGDFTCTSFVKSVSGKVRLNP